MAGNFVDSLVIAVGIDTSQIADGIQKVGAKLDSGLSAAAQSAATRMSPLGEAMKNLASQADGIKAPVEEGLKALNELGIRSTEQIQQKIAELQEALAKVNASTTLTARDKQAAIDEITKRIGLLKNELEKGIPQAAAQGFAGAETAANKFKGVLSSIWAQVSGPLLGAFAVGGTISNYISNATSAGELADRLKTDVVELQVWSGAMERAGGSAQALQGTIEKLTKSGKDNGDVFGTLMDLAEKAEHMTKEAFIEHARRLEIDEATVQVLAQGKKTLEAHLKKQEELGAYTKEDAEQSKRFKQSLADLLHAWDSFTSFIGRFTVPVMKWLADVLTSVVVGMRRHTPLVAAAIGLVGAALASRLLPPLRELPKLIANVSKSFLRWMPFVAVVAGLAILVDDFYAYLVGGKSAFGDFWAILGTGPEIMAKLNSAWNETKAVLAVVGTGAAQLVRYWYDLMRASGMLNAVGQTFRGLLQILKGVFTLDWSLIGEGLSNVLNGMVKGVASAFKGLGILARDAMRAIWSALRSYVPGFATWADGIADTLSGIFHLDLGKVASGIGKLFSGMGTMLVSGIKGLLNLSANAWSAIIEVFTGQKIDLAKWVNEAWDKASAKFTEIKDWVLNWISGLFGGGEAPDFGAMAQKIWDSITKTFDDLKQWVVNWFKGLFTGIEVPSIGDILGGAGDLAKGAAGAVGGLLGKGLDLAKAGAGTAGDLIGGLLGSASEGASKVGEKLTPVLQEGLGIAQRGLSAAGDFFSGLFKDAAPATADAGAKVEDGMAKTAKDVEGGFTAAWKGASSAAVSLFGGAANEIRAIFGGIFAEFQTQAQAMVAGARAMVGGGAMVPAFAGVRPQAMGARNVNQSSSVHISQMTVNTRATDANGVAKGMQGALSKNRIVQSAQSGTVPK